MADKKKREPRFTTPKGVAVYPKLNVPDTKFDPNGVFSTRLALEGEEADALAAKIDAAVEKTAESALAELRKRKPKATARSIKRADLPYKAEENDEGEATGRTLFNFKRKAKVTRKSDGKEFEFSVALFDAHGDKTNVEVWGGSVVKVAYEMHPFNTAIGVGVSLRLIGVQIIELRTRGEEDAGAMGFGEEEGFVDDGSFDSTPKDEPDADDADADDADDGDDGPDGEREF